MTQTGANEKELVLGNRQLISLFFVGVALCGVFFAMGYMVGRNSAKTVLSATDPAGAAQSEYTVRRQQPESPRETVDPPAAMDTKPAYDIAPAEQPGNVPAPSAAAAAPAKELTHEPGSRIAISAPEPGSSYLQVTALPRPDAENMIQTLREQNFPVILAASSKENLFRVLVGPYTATAQLAEAKVKLKTLGFAYAFVQRQ